MISYGRDRDGRQYIYQRLRLLDPSMINGDYFKFFRVFQRMIYEY